MKSKRRKPATAQADQHVLDLAAGQTPPDGTLPLEQKETTSTTKRADGRDISGKEEIQLSAGDPDVSRQGLHTVEETPGGSNPTPDQDGVDEIGEAVGVIYQDGEPLKFGDKSAERDERRWEDDPASSEDYRERQASLEANSSSPKRHVEK
ncbi:MAG: DUF6335 family protein [Nitrospirota bacterium]